MLKTKFVGIVAGITLFTGVGIISTLDNGTGVVEATNATSHLKANDDLSYYKLDETCYFIDRDGQPIANPFKKKDDYVLATYEGFTEFEDGYKLHKYKDTQSNDIYYMGTATGVESVSYERAVKLLDLKGVNKLVNDAELLSVNPDNGYYESWKLKKGTHCKIIRVEQTYKKGLYVRIKANNHVGYVPLKSLMK